MFHMIVPGGGFSLDAKHWVSCRPRFFLSVEVLSALFRPLFLNKLRAAYRAGELQFFGKHAQLIDPRAFAAYLAPLWNTKWAVYCKRPSGDRRRCCAISRAEDLRLRRLDRRVRQRQCQVADCRRHLRQPGRCRQAAACRVHHHGDRQLPRPRRRGRSPM